MVKNSVTPIAELGAVKGAGRNRMVPSPHFVRPFASLPAAAEGAGADRRADHDESAEEPHDFTALFGAMAVLAEAPAPDLSGDIVTGAARPDAAGAKVGAADPASIATCLNDVLLPEPGGDGVPAPLAAAADGREDGPPVAAARSESGDNGAAADLLATDSAPEQTPTHPPRAAASDSSAVQADIRAGVRPALQTLDRPAGTAFAATAAAETIAQVGLPAGAARRYCVAVHGLTANPTAGYAPSAMSPSGAEPASAVGETDRATLTDPTEGAPLRARPAQVEETAAPVNATSNGGAGSAGQALAAPAAQLSGSEQAAAAPASAEGAPDLARQIAQRIGEAFRHLEKGAVEVALAPEELGHVRLVFRHHDSAAPTILLQADRPETLDLMRRHVDLLAQDMRDLGYGDVTFLFQEHGQSPEYRRPATRSDPAFTPDDPSPAIHTPIPPPAGAADGALDLRI